MGDGVAGAGVERLEVVLVSFDFSTLHARFLSRIFGNQQTKNHIGHGHMIVRLHLAHKKLQRILFAIFQIADLTRKLPDMGPTKIFCTVS